MSTRLSASYRTAFVTGASTGLGRAFTEMLLAEGVAVWGTSRDLSRLSPLTTAHPEAFHAVALDLRDAASAERMFLAADSDAGGFDIVINNAGYGVFGDFTAIEFQVWQEQLEVMLIAPARLNHAALRLMRPRAAAGRRCVLVNISSLAAEFPLPFQSAYNICKAGLTALSESLIAEVSDTGIVILDVRPGDYRTDFETSVRRPTALSANSRAHHVWRAFEAMMRGGPPPEHAARALRRALARGRSGTVRTGRWFQAFAAPFLARFGSLGVKRRVQARYFDLS